MLLSGGSLWKWQKYNNQVAVQILRCDRWIYNNWWTEYCKCKSPGIQWAIRYSDIHSYLKVKETLVPIAIAIFDKCNILYIWNLLIYRLDKKAYGRISGLYRRILYCLTQTSSPTSGMVIWTAPTMTSRTLRRPLTSMRGSRTSQMVGCPLRRRPTYFNLEIC